MKKYLLALTCVAAAALIFIGGCQEQAKTPEKPAMAQKTEPAAPAEQAKPQETVVEQKPAVEQAKPEEPVAEQKPAAEPAKPQEAAKPEKAPVTAAPTEEPKAVQSAPETKTPAQTGKTEPNATDKKFAGVEAIVNGTPITTAQVKEAIKEDLAQIDKQLPENVREVYKNREIQKTVQSMIEEKLVDAEIAKAGIVITDQDVENYINQNLADANMPKAQLLEKIKADGMTYEQWKEKMQFRKGLAFQKLTDAKYPGKLTVEPNEVKDFYTKNPQYFDVPEQVKASHILIKVEEGNDPNLAKLKAKAKAEDILKQIKAGADFAEMAKKYSSCPSAAQGGDLGFFSKEKMVKPFSDAAFAMKVGEISGVVETQFGYHIIKVTDKKPAEKITFEKAQKDISNYLKMQKRQQVEKEYKDSLKKAADIVYPPGKDPKELMSRRPMMMPGAHPAAPKPGQTVTPAQPKEVQPK